MAKCEKCGSNEGTDELHSCPYAEEIANDCTETCNCCDTCYYECCMDI